MIFIICARCSSRDSSNRSLQFSSWPKDYENFGLKKLVSEEKSVSVCLPTSKLELDSSRRKSKLQREERREGGGGTTNKLCITNVLLTHCHFLIQLKNVCFAPHLNTISQAPSQAKWESFLDATVAWIRHWESCHEHTHRDTERGCALHSQTLIWHSYAKRNESCDLLACNMQPATCGPANAAYE